MVEMSAFIGLTFRQLQSRMKEDGLNPVHATVVFRSLHRKGARMTNQGDRVDAWLARHPGVAPEVVRDIASGDQVTRKFLLRLEDGRDIETVLMGYEGRYTACVSSQVGCAMGCVFCATGKMGFLRHLTAREMVAQVHFLNEHLAAEGKTPLRNVVMMGMGEPLHNFGPVIDALDVITDARGVGIAPTRVSISTVGHIPGIQKLAALDRKYALAVSLHGVSDEERGALIPVNKRWPIRPLLEACRSYSEVTGQKVLISWTLIAGANDSDDHATRLAELLRGMKVQVNLIPLNPTEDFEGRPPSDERVLEFQRILKESGGLPVTIRQRRGIDVGAGCGQLAG